MIKNIPSSWKAIITSEIDKPYFLELNNFLDSAYENSICYPPKNDVFNAFKHCQLSNLKVVIIGQDPYHGKGQANGLCFSVHNEVKHPPSLINIFKELILNYNSFYPSSGDLTSWAKQGVLLLNATLTVEEGKAGSHQKKGWEIFTDALIKAISNEKRDVVFLLWGGYARKKVKLIDSKKHHVLETGHPSPLSANRGYWFGNKHFLKTNEYLIFKNKDPIDWLL
jgi:uracil-DNA glycosylase